MYKRQLVEGVERGDRCQTLLGVTGSGKTFTMANVIARCNRPTPVSYTHLNVATIPGSTQRVEYAIKMPGTDGGTVWLPIDSKFPGDTYAHLQDAQDVYKRQV